MQLQPEATTTAIMDAVRRIVQALRVSSRQAEVEVGVSGAQLFILRKLAESEAPLSLSELAERTLTDPSSASTVVARLVDRGFVLKAASAADRRVAELRLSYKGRAFLAKDLPETAQEKLALAVARLPDPERRDLARLLSVVITDAGFSSKDAPMFFEEHS